MGIAILSPCLLTYQDINSEPTKEFCDKITSLLMFIRDETNLRIEWYEMAPYAEFPMGLPCTHNGTMANYIASNIYKLVQQLLDKENYVMIDGKKEAEIISDLVIPESKFRSPFLKYIGSKYQSEKNDHVVFVGPLNFKKKRPYTFALEGNSFMINGSESFEIELTSVLYPFFHDDVNWNVFFPRASVCKNYNEYVQKQSMHLSESEQQALFQDISNIVAKINGYEKDTRLTRLNNTNNSKRIVYSKTRGERSYLSIDYESGGMEVFDKDFFHQGQYNFSCEIAKKADPRNHYLYH